MKKSYSVVYFSNSEMIKKARREKKKFKFRIINFHVHGHEYIISLINFKILPRVKIHPIMNVMEFL